MLTCTVWHLKSFHHSGKQRPAALGQQPGLVRRTVTMSQSAADITLCPLQEARLSLPLCHKDQPETISDMVDTSAAPTTTSRNTHSHMHMQTPQHNLSTLLNSLRPDPVSLCLPSEQQAMHQHCRSSTADRSLPCYATLDRASTLVVRQMQSNIEHTYAQFGIDSASTTTEPYSPTYAYCYWALPLCCSQPTATGVSGCIIRPTGADIAMHHIHTPCTTLGSAHYCSW